MLTTSYVKGFSRLNAKIDSSALDSSCQVRDLAAERRRLGVICGAHEELTRERGVTEEESAHAWGHRRQGRDRRRLLRPARRTRRDRHPLGDGDEAHTRECALQDRRIRGTDSGDTRAFATEYAPSESFRRANQHAEEANAYLSRPAPRTTAQSGSTLMERSRCRPQGKQAA